MRSLTLLAVLGVAISALLAGAHPTSSVGNGGRRDDFEPGFTSGADGAHSTSPAVPGSPGSPQPTPQTVALNRDGTWILKFGRGGHGGNGCNGAPGEPVGGNGSKGGDGKNGGTFTATISANVTILYSGADGGNGGKGGDGATVRGKGGAGGAAGSKGTVSWVINSGTPVFGTYTPPQDGTPGASGTDA